MSGHLAPLRPLITPFLHSARKLIPLRQRSRLMPNRARRIVVSDIDLTVAESLGVLQLPHQQTSHRRVSSTAS